MRDSIGRFDIEIFELGKKELLGSAGGVGEEWKQLQTVSASIHGDSFVIDISRAWKELFRSHMDKIDTEALGLCTIIKFGDTMQLRNKFRVKIRIRPKDR